MTVCMWCSMRSTVWPRARMSRMWPAISRFSDGFMPAAGSSRRSSAGAAASARAISVRRRFANESVIDEVVGPRREAAAEQLERGQRRGPGIRLRPRDGRRPQERAEQKP